MTDRPTALILDFGGVLTTDFYGALDAFCVREGLAPDALTSAVTGEGPGRAVLSDLERGAIDQGEFATRMAALLGVAPDRLLERIAADLRPNEAMIAAAAAIRGAGVPAAILSNSWGIEPFNPYAPWRLEQNFDHVVISDQVRLRKPDPAIYKIAVAALDVPPERCVFVDDIAAYLEPARAMGMTVIHQVDTTATIRRLEDLFGLALQPS